MAKNRGVAKSNDDREREVKERRERIEDRKTSSSVKGPMRKFRMPGRVVNLARTSWWKEKWDWKGSSRSRKLT